VDVVERIGTRTSRLRALANRPMHFGPAFAFLSRERIAVLISLGLIFRVAQWLADRQIWLDEGSLAGNISTLSLPGLFGPLSGGQIAPPGFLVVEWVICRTLGCSAMALRLFPLVCGVGSIFVFRAVAERCLRPGAVWIAMALFAVCDDLIYYASELKQYSTDVAAALICTRMGLALESRPATIPQFAPFAVAGAAIVWFSHASAIVLAGVGLVLLVSAIAQRDGRRFLLLGLICLIWAASFAGVNAIGHEQLGHSKGMWAFWNFAFPPMPPASFWDATWTIRRFLLLFVNPLNFNMPFGPRLSILPALGAFLAGCVSLWKRSRRLFGFLAGPGLVAIVLAHLQYYPFHGRLILFLVPSLLLFIAEGAGWACATVQSPTLRIALLAAILLFPTLQAFYHLADPRDRYDFNRHGDRRPAKLDPYLYPFWSGSPRRGKPPG
jgi:hypothetical protein